MEKERFLGVNWQSLNAVMPPQMNSGAVADQLPQPFLNLGWEQPMPHDVQFESALSSLVSSQSSNPPAGNDTVAIRELIGRLGSVCYSGEISPSSANACCYSTPLSSSPKLNLTMMDHQQQCRGGLPMPGNPMEARQFAPFSANPGFAERVSCFGARSYGVLGGQFGLSEARKLSRVSSSQSLKAAGGPEMGVPGNGKEAPVSDPERSEMEMRSMYGGRMSSASTPDETEFGNGQDSSSASDRMPAGGTENNAKKRKAATRSKGKEAPFSSSNTYPPKSAEEETSNAKRCEPAETNGADKDAAVKPKTDQNDDAKPLEPPKDYIHVRARRGQATDSHSLAERVRREKITARMKLLQDLVPGCNKITGKAVMLDEIINYVQSLQRQVEFLSTKLATLNPHLGFNMENLLGKDMHQEHGPFPQQVYPLDITTTAFSYAQQPRGPPLQSVATGVLDMQASLSPLDSSLRPHPNMQLLPALDGFADTTSQLGNLWGDDLQYVVQMGLGQSQETSFSSQILHDE